MDASFFIDLSKSSCDVRKNFVREKYKLLQVSNSQAFVDFCQRWTSPPSRSPEKANNSDTITNDAQDIEDVTITATPTEDGS